MKKNVTIKAIDLAEFIGTARLWFRSQNAKTNNRWLSEERRANKYIKLIYKIMGNDEKKLLSISEFIEI